MREFVFDPETQVADYDDVSLTENTRVANPLESIPKCAHLGEGTHRLKQTCC